MKRVPKGLGVIAACLAVVIGVSCAFPVFVVAKGNGRRAALLEAETLFNLARLAMKKGKYAEAEGYLKDLVKLPFSTKTKAQNVLRAGYVVLVDAQLRQKERAKVQEAKTTAKEALALPIFKKPSIYKAELYKLLAKAYEALGNEAEASKYFKMSMGVSRKLKHKNN